MTDAEETDYQMLTRKIARDRGFACASYKDRCVRRRIAVRMRARAVHTYADYSSLLDSDPTEYEHLLEALTINVTKLYRNPEVYEAISRQIIPALWALPDRQVRIWSAGCASGEEVWSLAMLLHRYAETTGRTSELARFRVIGTDIDRPSLAAAAEGSYGEMAFGDMPRDLRERYFSAGFPARVNDELRPLAAFREADLFSAADLPAPFHLVVCRNVLIYFDKASQEKLFQRFHSSLAASGFLVLGKVETILGDARTLFAPLDPRERLFRKK